MPPNFTACAAKFEGNLALYDNYTWKGPAPGFGDDVALLTLQGCYDLCGKGYEKYPWSEASGTILTWVMPMLAMVVKAPFGAGSPPKKTLQNLFRWIGSPVASLAYIFWNIKVSGKCAMMVDMASSYDDVPGPDSEFAGIRDSLYILSVMNQYSIRTGMPSIEAEKLLRVALFSDTLKLVHDDARPETLPEVRQKLAYRLRAGRRQGLVPVFLSTVWWMFGLSVSLENAFGKVGANATAHNLAIGLMLAWFPVVTLCSVVDRTPWATDEIRVRLNNLLDKVRVALLTEDLRDTYMRQEGRSPDEFSWTKSLESQNIMGHSGFFTGFAGQGRVRFHYGVANPILTGIEEAGIAQKGRGWLGTTEAQIWQSRTSMVLGPNHGHHLEGLRYFDPREFWEVLSSILVVGGPVVGAFVISYFTPTVGLGCRSGGYTIFFIISFAEALFEALAWWLLPEAVPKSMRASVDQDLSSTPTSRLHHFFSRVQACYIYDKRRFLENSLLRPMELTNAAWLVYIICAQTFGTYNTCFCKSSTWAGGGGYVSFVSSQYLKDHGVTLYWAVGTATSLIFMAGGIAYIVAEWLTQSHMNTTNYANAARGLRRTRTFKRYTLWARVPVDIVLTATRVFWEATRKSKQKGRRSLVWTWQTNPERLSPIDGVECETGLSVGGVDGITSSGGEGKEMISHQTLAVSEKGANVSVVSRDESQSD